MLLISDGHILLDMFYFAPITNMMFHVLLCTDGKQHVTSSQRARAMVIISGLRWVVWSTLATLRKCARAFDCERYSFNIHCDRLTPSGCLRIPCCHKTPSVRTVCVCACAVAVFDECLSCQMPQPKHSNWWTAVSHSPSNNRCRRTPVAHLCIRTRARKVS